MGAADAVDPDIVNVPTVCAAKGVGRAVNDPRLCACALNVIQPDLPDSIGETTQQEGGTLKE